MENTETQTEEPKSFTITANYDYTIKLKDRFKILFSGKLSTKVDITVKEQPEIISNSSQLIFK